MAESSREEIAKLEAIYANNPGGRVFTHLAEAYRKAGELDAARSILEAGIARHPDYASAHVVLGRVLMDQHAPESAVGSFRRVLELDPENRVALRSLGDLARQNRPGESLGYYRQLQALDPSDEDLAQLIEQIDAHLVTGATVTFATVRFQPPFQVKPVEPPEQEPAESAVWRPATQPLEEPPVDQGEEDDTREAMGDAEQWGWRSLARPEEQDGAPEPGLASWPFEPQEAAADAEAAAWQESTVEPAETAPDEEQLLVVDLDASLPMGDPGFEEFLSTPLDGASVDHVQEDIPTETLAELYRSQGFYDRAAEVYRALLALKPQDPRLRQRLAEVIGLDQAAALEPISGMTFDDPTSGLYLDVDATLASGEVESARADDEAWVEGVESAWTGSSGAADLDSPYAWELEPEQEDAGTTLQDYLARILAWQPEVEPVEAVTLEPPTNAEPGWEQGADPAPVPDSTGLVREQESPWWGNDSLPWEGTLSEAPLARDAIRHQDGVEDAFEEWYSGGSPSAPGQGGSVDPAATQPSPGLPSVSADSADDESDDDLEMFRSWLQSLKR